MGRIADLLHEAGHDVTVLHQVSNDKHTMTFPKKAKQILLDLPQEMRVKLNPERYNTWVSTGSMLHQLQFIRTFVNTQVEACDMLLGDNRTIEALRKEHFDAGITEMIVTCGFGLFDMIGVDHIICASAVGISDAGEDFFDVPGLSSFKPSFLTKFSDKMNFMERTINFISSFVSKNVIKYMYGEYEIMWQRHGVDRKMEDYRSKINYVLSNSDEFMEIPSPTTAKIVHVGGITIAEKSELPQKFRSLMERKDRTGVVYISFGSLVPTKQMPNYFRETIFHVASSFPQITFLWKMDADDTPPEIPNLHTFSWLPQQALLAHPNLLCFVSHAGLNSVLELTRSGKPSILVPVFADQFRNARLVERKNTTIVLMKETFNNKTFESALRRIISDESYGMRAKRLASLMVNKPFPIKERVLSTVQFSIQHGKINSLDTYGRNLNTLQYYSIDVVAFLATIGLLIIISLISSEKKTDKVQRGLNWQNAQLSRSDNALAPCGADVMHHCING
ncbi:hypothetical protein RB195_016249 [Necator americanus]|uniref:glucuronosyltransferase n=1 Tax=Necator americanus TaxID=51031 RepID=A0ABR1E890_NECAM